LTLLALLSHPSIYTHVFCLLYALLSSPVTIMIDTGGKIVPLRAWNTLQ
jgi:hypothetical protein